MNPKPRPRRGQGGFVLVLSGIVLLTMFALMVVAIDIGRISHTATEVQGIADSAALAGAKAVIEQGPGNAEPAATAAAGDNRFDGRNFVDGTNGRLDVVEGRWDPGSASFTAGDSPPNAVRAIATGQSVRYVAAPLIGIGPATDIRRQAVAVIGAPSASNVGGPLAVCSNVTNGVNPQPPGPCAGGDGSVIKTIPDLVQQGASQNSCFSGLGTGANSNNEVDLLPAQCGGTVVATVSVGEIISLDNGQNAAVFHKLKDCVDPTKGNVHRFILPVIDDCRCNSANLPVTGFVEIQIDDPGQVFDGGSPKYIHGAKQICDSQLTNGPISLSGNDFGFKETRLAQ